MNIKEVAITFNLTEGTIKNWIKIGLLPEKEKYAVDDIERVISSKSHSRRNKKKSESISIPESYIKSKQTVDLIQKIMQLQEQLQCDSNHIFIVIIKKLLGDRMTTQIENSMYQVFGYYEHDLFLETLFNEITLNYDKDEDFLGALYSSSLTVGTKSTNGIYYTPFNVVENMVNSIDANHIQRGNKIVDPACGSGNFLISIINKMKNHSFEQQEIVNTVYGYDIDPVAIFLAKINVYIILNEIDFSEINIYKQDFLLSEITNKFNVVIGNPPWGSKFDKDYKEKLKKKLYFKAYKQDSFALFIEKAFSILKNQGHLQFVLPVAFLNVIKHQEVRKKCLQYKIISIEVLGREFSEVVTENLIIHIEKTELNNSSSKLLYNKKEIDQDYFKNNPSNSFLIVENNLVQSIIDKINNFDSTNLTKNTKFGLGIVTGNNKEFLSLEKNRYNELIASGKNIEKFYVNSESISNYIVFNPELYQQVAPVEIYRHNSRILYNFIGKKIKFAYDNTGLLTLNSANIICLYEGWDPFFVLAILNSRLTQLYYQNIFKTHKMLRNHIESFKVFVFDSDTQKQISEFSKEIFEKKDLENYEKIESIIYNKLGLTDDEIEYLHENII